MKRRGPRPGEGFSEASLAARVERSRRAAPFFSVRSVPCLNASFPPRKAVAVSITFWPVCFRLSACAAAAACAGKGRSWSTVGPATGHTRCGPAMYCAWRRQAETRKRQARPSAWWAGAHTWPPWISRPDCTPRPWLEKRATASRFVWTSCCLGGKSGRACSIGSIFPPRAWWRSPWTKREPSGGGEPRRAGSWKSVIWPCWKGN